MTLKELQLKNARISAERETSKKIVEAIHVDEIKQPTIQPVEETPHVVEVQNDVESSHVEDNHIELLEVSENTDSNEIVVENTEAQNIEPEIKPKKAMKPVNREYMVVEQIPEE